MAVLMTLTITAFSGCMKKEPSEYVLGTTTGNSANGGMVTSDSDWVYYVNVDDGGSIYKMKPDGTEKSLVKDCRAYYLNVYGDYLYFLDYNEHGFIHKMKKTGGEATVVYKAIGTYLNVCDGLLYFSITPSKNTHYGQVYSVDTDGNVPRRVTFEFAGNVSCYDGYCYTCDEDGNIHRYSIDERKDEVIAETDAQQMCVNGYGIFYINGSGKVKKLSFEGNKSTLFTDAGIICLDGKYLYYTDAAGNGIYKYDVTDTHVEQISYAEGVTAINTDGKYVYYYTIEDGGRGYRMTDEGKSPVSLAE